MRKSRIVRRFICRIAAVAIFCVAGVVGAEPLHDAELVFGLEAWHNHASCVVECPNGDLLVCWYHGSGERQANDVVIEGARLVHGETKWRPRFVMADTPGYPDCNPCMVVDPQERLWLFWPTILDNHWESALLKCKTSTDYQRRDADPVWDWHDVVHLTPTHFAEDIAAAADRVKEKYAEKILEKIAAEVYLQKIRMDAAVPLNQRLGWMPRCHPTILPTGRMILPLYTDRFSVSLVAITDDSGRTWQTSRALVGFGNIQASLVRKNDGTLVAMMRENGPLERIRICESADDGMTWGPVGEMDLPNPGAGVEAVRLRNGRWALVYNDTTDGRHSLAVSISDDEGKTWKWTRHLERVPPGEGSFSYPSIIQTRDGMLHVTYSVHLSREKAGDNRKAIKHAAFNEEWVKGQ